MDFMRLTYNKVKRIFFNLFRKLPKQESSQM